MIFSQFKALPAKAKVAALIIVLVSIFFFAWVMNKINKTTPAQTVSVNPIETNALLDSQAESARQYTAQIERLNLENDMLRTEIEQERATFQAEIADISTRVSEQIADAIAQERRVMDERYSSIRSRDESTSLEEAYEINRASSAYGRIRDRQQISTATESPAVLSTTNGSIIDALSSIEEPVKPVYTIPIGSTLVDATSMTALIGRVPIRGQVTDPYPFKLIIGGHNLAANGIQIPNLTGVIVSGTATGDMQLSCVRGIVKTLTFVFTDGTISTTEEDSGLGYISTPTGVPCVQGEFISDAVKFLTAQIGLGAARGAANAYAQNQVFYTTGAFGTDAFVAGDAAKFVAGNAAAEGLGEAQQWLNERMRDSFDAVYVPSNEQLVVNIDTQIEIDYDDEGRRVSYPGQRADVLYTQFLD